MFHGADDNNRRIIYARYHRRPTVYFLEDIWSYVCARVVIKTLRDLITCRNLFPSVAASSYWRFLLNAGAKRPLFHHRLQSVCDTKEMAVCDRSVWVIHGNPGIGTSDIPVLLFGGRRHRCGRIPVSLKVEYIICQLKTSSACCRATGQKYVSVPVISGAFGHDACWIVERIAPFFWFRR